MRRLLALLLLAAGCATEPGAPEWLVAAPRLLAVKAEPPEAKPGERPSFRVLLAGPDGELDATGVVWANCTAPLPLTESGSVSTACLGALTPVAEGGTASVTLPSDGCSRFGPIGSPEVQRARQPDSTGGYYQPIRVQSEAVLAYAFERLRCPLAQASLSVAQEFEQLYLANRNPAIATLAATPALDAVRAGSTVELQLSWNETSVETFPVFDVASFQLVAQRETMTVSWFASSGTLSQARTGTSGNQVTNQWLAPLDPGSVYIWAVLRDSRGGVDWTSGRAMVVEELE